MSLRTNDDGSVWLPRHNKAQEDHLDLTMDREPGLRKWYPKFKSRDFNEIYDLIKGKEVNIIGKGPSLDFLRASDLGDRPTFAINESIHQVEKYSKDPLSTFCITQDYNLKSTCRPKGSGLIVNNRIASWYHDYPRLWIFSLTTLGLHEASLTAIVALKIAELGGATHAKMLCFDASINRDVGYAKVIGTRPERQGAPSRFLGHRKYIEEASKLSKSWALPELQADGKVQQ